MIFWLRTTGRKKNIVFINYFAIIIDRRARKIIERLGLCVISNIFTFDGNLERSREPRFEEGSMFDPDIKEKSCCSTINGD